jgi:hypothetical protein
MSASGAEAVAPILLARYRPSLLVYVVTARDLGDSVDGPLLADTPWVQYQRGRFSASGWLVEHSAAFRYYLLYRQWLDPMRWPAATSPSGTTAGGYFPVNAGLPLSPELWAHTQNAYAAGADRLPSDVEIDGLEKLLHLAGRATQIVVVEAPLHVRVQRWVRHAGHFYADAVAQIRRTTQRQRIPFWRLAGWRVIPADGWMDFVHLNRLGATRFSEWLGERIAAAVDSGRLRGPGEPTRA